MTISLLVSCLVCAQAQSVLVNGDFADGLNGWILSQPTATVDMIVEFGTHTAHIGVSPSAPVGYPALTQVINAGPGDVLRAVVAESMAPVLAGVGIGLAASLGLTRLMASMLYGVKASDPATFGAVALILSAVALAASIVPARRATRIDPTMALRHE